MKPLGLLLSLVSAAGLLIWTIPSAISQTPAYGERLVSAPGTPTYRLTEEILSVQAALSQFDTALALHDVGGLQAIGIKRVSAKRWQQFFKDNPSATVTDRCVLSELSISNGTANWTCMETATIISEDKPKAFVHEIRFVFAKTDGRWMILDRR